MAALSDFPYSRCAGPLGIPSERMQDLLKVGWQFDYGFSFGTFQSVETLFETLSRYPTQHAYEQIVGSRPHKMYFDLDHKGSDDPRLIESLLAAINQVLEENGHQRIIPADVLIYSSHGPEKTSYHAIVHTLAWADHKEAKWFATQLPPRMPAEFQDSVDVKIYTSLRLFRLVGSTKLKANRIKRLHESYVMDGYSVYQAPADTPLEELRRSLIGVLSDTTQVLPRWCAQREAELAKERLARMDAMIVDGDQPDSVNEYDLIQKIVAEYDSQRPESEQLLISFTMADANSQGVYKLTRQQPSWCPLCKRIHESENQYITRTRKGEVVLRCHRCMDSKTAGAASRWVKSAPVEDTKLVLGVLKQDPETLENDPALQSIFEEYANSAPITLDQLVVATPTPAPTPTRTKRPPIFKKYEKTPPKKEPWQTLKFGIIN